MISVTTFGAFLLPFSVSCSFLHWSSGDQRCLQLTASCALSNWEQLCLCSACGGSFQTHSLLTPPASSSLIIQVLVEVSVTLSLCALIAAAPSCLCGCGHVLVLIQISPSHCQRWTWSRILSHKFVGIWSLSSMWADWCSCHSSVSHHISVTWSSHPAEDSWSKQHNQIQNELP